MGMAWWSRTTAAVLVASVLLSGCSSSGKDGTSSSSSSSAMAPAVVARIDASCKPLGNATTTSCVVADHQGSGGMAMGNHTMSGNMAMGNASGTDPQVGQVIVFDAGRSTGAIASYEWTLGDNATSANKRVEHAYAKSGTYTVTLRVRGLHNETGNATLHVTVAASPVGQPLFKDHQEFSGSLPLMNPNSCTNQGVDCDDHAVTLVAKDKNGTAAMAKHVWINVTGSSPASPAANLQVMWRAPDGTNLVESDASGTEFHLDYTGAMPAGDYVVRVRLFTGAQVDYTATVDIQYVHA